MPSAPTLLERRAAAIVRLNTFMCQECGAARIPEQALRRPANRSFVAGWRLNVLPLQQERQLEVYVDSVFPFSAPRFLLVNGPPFLTWPHVDEDGMLCLGDETQPVDVSKPAEAAADLLANMAYPLLRSCEVGSNREDFRSEFFSYWNRAVSDGSVVFRSLINPRGPSRPVRIWRDQHFVVVGETEDQVMTWLKNLFGDQKHFEKTEASCLLWLDSPPLPNEYPETASDVLRAATAVGASDLVLRSISKERASVPLIIGATSDNGPCFGSVTISKPTTTNMFGRRVDQSERGFRPNRLPQQLLARRVLNSATRISRSRVERADSSWIHGRDQDPRHAILKNCRVVMVGCGAIGAPVAIHLAMAGVGSLRLIDPEILSWSNVGRHPLGADSVGRGKASELAKKLRSSFPHGSFEYRDDAFENVLANQPEFLEFCNLVVCATGIWSVESAINAWHLAENGPAHLMYSWTEPHAVAGHAVAIRRGDACLQCQFSRDGDSKLIVTDWKETGRRREPACGAIYQPYGPAELSWTTALASALALDCLLGQVSWSTHRIWAGPKALLVSAGGGWNADWIGDKKEREAGGFLEERIWVKDAVCSICD